MYVYREVMSPQVLENAYDPGRVVMDIWEKAMREFSQKLPEGIHWFVHGYRDHSFGSRENQIVEVYAGSEEEIQSQIKLISKKKAQY
jgi:hypothetical protein